MMGQVALVPGEVTNVREVGLVTRGCVVPGVMEAWLVSFYLLETQHHHLNIYIDCCYSSLFGTQAGRWMGSSEPYLASL